MEAIPEIIAFLSELKENNNKEWFGAQKKRYDALKAAYISIVEEIIAELTEFIPEMSNCQAKSSIFRINRDIRFSTDKSPYKTNFGAYFNPAGKKSPKAGYYLHLEPGKSFLGGGLYMPASDVLKKVRQEVDYNFDEFRSIVDSKEFKKWYPEVFKEDKLSRPPKDYEASNPAIEYLKLKHLLYTHDFDVLTLKSQKELIGNVTKAFKTLKPFIDFLNQGIDD